MKPCETKTRRAFLLAAHRLSAEKGTIYFLVTGHKERKLTIFSGIGCKYQNELTGDWETDMLRTGCLGIVSINLPRSFKKARKTNPVSRDPQGEDSS